MHLLHGREAYHYSKKTGPGYPVPVFLILNDILVCNTAYGGLHHLEEHVRVIVCAHKQP